ncbi:MAG: cytochrome c biogenesis protein [Candidatus Kapaibacteriota bacterium]
MKFAIMLGATLLGIALGYLPSITKPRPRWWRMLALGSVTVVVVLALLPPTAGTVTDAVIASRADSTAVVPVLLRSTLQPGAELSSIVASDARDQRVVITVILGPTIDPSLLPIDQPVILYLQRYGQDAQFVAQQVGQTDPLITLPYIMGLEERARIIFFHVPMSWVASIAYILGMIYAVAYLRTRKREYDTLSASAARIATLYAILATVTGAIWAKFNWGMFWNWDPRQTSIFLLLLVYGAYFLLRSAVTDPTRRASLSAAYSIIAAPTVPFLIYILPRLIPGLHPGSADDVNAGPLLSPQSDAINTVKQMIFGGSLFSFTLIFFWLVSIDVRTTVFSLRKQ